MEDPSEIRTNADLGRALDALRQRYGLSYGKMETRARRLGKHLPHQTANDAVKNGTSTWETVETFLVVCDVSAEEFPRWNAAWRACQESGRQRDAPVIEPEFQADLIDLDSVELIRSVQEAHQERVRATVDRLGVPMAERWGLDELGRLRRAVETRAIPGHLDDRRCIDLLGALCEAVEAKAVLAALGGSHIRLERLKWIYQDVIRRAPSSNTADGLLVEAAQVTVVERRETSGLPLTALTRFVLAVAADPQAAAGRVASPAKALLASGSPLAGWIRRSGHQFADAEAYLHEATDRPGWLVIDLDDEPQLPGQSLWPRTLTASLYGGSVPMSNKETCAGDHELEATLRRLLEPFDIQFGTVVDICAPRALLERGVEHMDIIGFDRHSDYFEPLIAGYLPRLRWSKRQRDHGQYRRLRERVRQSLWNTNAVELPSDRCEEPRAVLDWLRQHLTSPVVLASPTRGPGGVDPLQIALQQGCGFVLWFPEGPHDDALKQVLAKAEQIPVDKRRTRLPDSLSDLPIQPLILWDDPDGRGGIQGPPPPVRLSSPFG